MELGLTVFSVVLIVTVLLGFAGYLIDRSVESNERSEGR
jgi:hypothetical protein